MTWWGGFSNPILTKKQKDTQFKKKTLSLNLNLTSTNLFLAIVVGWAFSGSHLSLQQLWLEMALVLPAHFSTQSYLTSSVLPPIQWQYWDGGWKNYSPSDNALLEQTFQRGVRECHLSRYLIFIPEMLQMNMFSSFRRAVRRFGDKQNYSSNIWEYSADGGVNWSLYSPDDCDTLDMAAGKFDQV